MAANTGPKQRSADDPPVRWLVLAQFFVLVTIVGFAILPLMTSVAAAIACVASMVSAVKSEGNTRTPAMACLVLGVCCLVWTDSLTSADALQGCRLNGWRLDDAGNLRTIGDALVGFRNASGRWPDDLGELAKSGHLADADALVSPGQVTRASGAAGEATYQRYGYVYFGGQEHLPLLAGREVIAHTKPGLLDRPGILDERFFSTLWALRRLQSDHYVNVLYADGSVHSYHRQSKPISEAIGRNGEPH